MTTIKRNIIELSEIPTDIQDIEKLIEILNSNITEVNFILSQLTMSNMDGEIKDITIPATSTLRVNHKLRVIPAHRIILRQEGGGVIRDGNFTENYVELINDGSTSAKITVILNKG